MNVLERLTNSIVVPVVVLDKAEYAVPTALAIAAGNREKITALCKEARTNAGV